MPLATRPNATYELVLSTDAHLPEDKRPIFVFRYLNIIEWEEIAVLNDKFESSLNTGEMINLAFEVIEKTLCDWRNMKTVSGKVIPYNPEKLKSMVTLQEATELMQAAVSQTPSLEDKKKSDSQSDSNTAKSAKAVKAQPNAQTSQPKPVQ